MGFGNSCPKSESSKFEIKKASQGKNHIHNIRKDIIDLNDRFLGFFNFLLIYFNFFYLVVSSFAFVYLLFFVYSFLSLYIFSFLFIYLCFLLLFWITFRIIISLSNSFLLFLFLINISLIVWDLR